MKKTACRHAWHRSPGATISWFWIRISTDRTVEIAKEAGARVYQHKYETETRQRMYGLKEIEFKHKWVYMPDADEITPEDLRDEMLAIAADPDRPEAMFSARYKNMFMGRWIKHSSLYPTWITRLCRPERIHYERECHSRPVGDGPTGRLQSHFVHYSFNKGMTAWFDKHNRYSGFEARESLQILRSKRIPWTGFLQCHTRGQAASTEGILIPPAFPSCSTICLYVFLARWFPGRLARLSLLPAHRVLRVHDRHQDERIAAARTRPFRYEHEPETFL